MKKLPKILIVGLILCSSGIASFQAHDGHKKDIVETAIYGGIFKTFISAIKEADLVEILQKGQFTVFVPTDEAFAKMPKGSVESLLKPENKKGLGRS